MPAPHEDDFVLCWRKKDFGNDAAEEEWQQMRRHCPSPTRQEDEWVEAAPAHDPSVSTPISDMSAGGHGSDDYP